MMRHHYQRADFARLMDTSRPLTKLMKQWISQAKCEDTDLGYEDWKLATRNTRKAADEVDRMRKMEELCRADGTPFGAAIADIISDQISKAGGTHAAAGRTGTNDPE